MNISDFARNVELCCPTCGCRTFKFEVLEDSNYPDDHEFECIHCGSVCTYKKLLEQNRVVIDGAVSDMVDDVASAIAKDLSRKIGR